MTALIYLRIVIAGVSARIWRTLTGRPCRCEFCRAHAEFQAEQQARATGLIDEQGDAYQPAPPATHLPALFEIRQRRGL